MPKDAARASAAPLKRAPLVLFGLPELAVYLAVIPVSQYIPLSKARGLPGAQLEGAA